MPTTATNIQPTSTPPPPAVESWSVLERSITFNNPKISIILLETPSYTILPQATAELVHATIVLQSKLNRDNTKVVVREAFTKWAWNITAEGELKDDASLTPEERELWHNLIERSSKARR
jgi:hypothetical protein